LSWEEYVKQNGDPLRQPHREAQPDSEAPAVVPNQGRHP